MKKKLAVFVMAFAVLAFAEPAGAQPSGNVRRIGFLSVIEPSISAPWLKIFRKSLQKLGWVEGKNIRIEYRFMEGKRERLPALAEGLLRMKVEIIVVHGGHPARVIQRKSKTIPIVMAEASDAVRRGIVKTLAQPGGNITGLTSIQTDIAEKRLELLKEVVPGLSRVGVIWNPRGPASRHAWKEIRRSSRRLGVQFHSMELKGGGDLDKVFEKAVKAGVDSIAPTPGTMALSLRSRIAELAIKHRLPAIYGNAKYPEAGGLMSYARDTGDLYRRAAKYVDKILKGAEPASLPVEQPTKFNLIVNLKAASAIGLTIPPGFLFRATEIIR